MPASHRDAYLKEILESRLRNVALPLIGLRGDDAYLARQH